MRAETSTATPPVDLSRSRRVHIVAIGGAGMSAIAIVLAEMGHHVTGSDLAPTDVVAGRLAAVGIDMTVGHGADHVGDAELVAVSTAVPADNPEVVEAERRGLPVLRRSELLAAVCAARPGIAVAGTHGKTTTSSMLAVALRGAGLDPSFIIGGDVAQLGGNAHWGSGPHFVVEADESDGTFIAFPRAAAIVTNVEPDHLEHYGGFEPLYAAFERLVEETEGPVVVCADDELAAGLARDRDVITYGLAEGATWRIVDLHHEGSGSRWTLRHAARGDLDVAVPVPGAHNAANATAAVVMAIESGADPGTVAEAIGVYRGVARRYEARGSAAGITFVDDYAHLPTEVRAAIAAGHQGGHRRVVVVFQPHRYSRTERLWRSFADAFEGADLLVLTDVYTAGEAPRPGVDGTLIVRAVLDAHPRQRVVYLPTLDDLDRYVPSLLRSGDLCLTLGAGDLTTMPDRWQATLGSDG
jgi:UDP-N-acetylmuramate--alanine ligase